MPNEAIASVVEGSRPASADPSDVARIGRRAAPAELERQIRDVRRDPLLMRALEMVPGFAWVLNPERQVVAANSRAVSMLPSPAGGIGLRPGEAVGCRVAADAPAGCGSASACSVCGLLATLIAARTEETPRTGECLIATTGGETLELEVAISHAEVEGVRFDLVGARDVSASRRRAVLERAFFHDVLNAVGALRGLLEVTEPSALSTPATTEVLRRLACQVSQEITAQREMVAAETGELTAHERPVRLGDLCEDLVRSYRGHEVGRGRELALELRSDPIVCTDPTLLGRVIGNLVKNALEASAPGERIAVVVGSSAEGGVQIAIANPAVMSDAVKHQLFRRSFSTKGPGRGVGSYSAKLLSERYLGGRLSFTSEPGDGTRFTVTLPASVLAGRLDDAEPTPGRPRSPAVGKPPRVLVVDDQSINRMIVTQQLQGLGCEADAVESADAALAALAEVAYDVVLTDLEMPEVNGAQMLHSIRASTIPRVRDVPVIVTSAASDDELDRAFDGLSFGGRLPKPFASDTLREALLAALPPSAGEAPRSSPA